jgi:hypothetical protein
VVNASPAPAAAVPLMKDLLFIIQSFGDLSNISKDLQVKK